MMNRHQGLQCCNRRGDQTINYDSPLFVLPAVHVLGRKAPGAKHHRFSRAQDHITGQVFGEQAKQRSHVLESVIGASPRLSLDRKDHSSVPCFVLYLVSSQSTVAPVLCLLV